MNIISSHLRTLRWASAALVLAAAPAWLSAQGIYRIVGPDGKVSFSDKPPTAKDKEVTPLSPGGRAPSADGGGDLPFELRQIVSRYPVTLYTGDNCEPCNAGRNLLMSRGVPFTERTVKTAKDIDALQRMGMQSTVPALTIGSQRLKGFSDGEWNEYLNAAGYPQTSRLPSSYRNPPAQALAPEPEVAPARAAAPAAPATPEIASPPPPSPSNPTGIVF